MFIIQSNEKSFFENFVNFEVFVLKNFRRKNETKNLILSK